MAAKNKDKCLKQSDWFRCSLCGKLFLPAEVEIHTTDCNIKHGYITGKLMQGKVVDMEGLVNEEGIPLKAKVRDYNSVLWLSIPVMEVCGFVIGQPCIVNNKLIKRTWPHWKKTSFDVAMTIDCMKELNIQKGDFVTLERYFHKGYSALKAELLLEYPNPYFGTSQFSSFLATYLDGKYITNGTPLKIHYFGSVCFGTLSNIQGKIDTDVTAIHSSSNNMRLFAPLTETKDDLSASKSLSEEIDDSFLTLQDIPLSFFHVSNNSLNESNVPVDLDKKIKVIAQCVPDPYIVDLNSSSVSFYQVLSSITKFTVVFKNTASHTKECSVKLNDLGGLDMPIKELKRRISRAIDLKEPCGCFLLHGPSGTGKTVFVNALAYDLGFPTFYVTEEDIVCSTAADAEINLKKIFNMAKDRAPSILVCDNLDVVFRKRTSYSDGLQEIKMRSFLSLIDSCSLQLNSAPVIIIGITNKKDCVHPALTRGGRFDCEIEVSVPTATQRLEILQMMMKRVKNNVTQEQLKQIADNTHGFVGADLMVLIKKSSKSEHIVTFDGLSFARHKVKPKTLKEIQFEVPQVRWSDIGGMVEVKMKLHEALVLPMTHAAYFERLNITPAKGLLMYGPPGCSKTMVAKALATESKYNFLSVKGPEIFNQFVGESEKAVREIFRKARLSAPSIIFFDEIDAIARKRGGSEGGGVNDRVLTQLLTEIDGLGVLKDVFILAATNRPDKIDQALLRPGRFDDIVYVPLPDDESRKEILKIKLSRMCVADDVQLELLVELTQDFSGAEIIHMCQEASLFVWREQTVKQVESRHFDMALQSIKPQTSVELLKIYQHFANSRKTY